jgi:hypothetical protein
MSAGRIRTFLLAAVTSVGLAGCIVIVDDGQDDDESDEASRRPTSALSSRS